MTSSSGWTLFSAVTFGASLVSVSSSEGLLEMSLPELQGTDSDGSPSFVKRVTKSNRDRTCQRAVSWMNREQSLEWFIATSWWSMALGYNRAQVGFVPNPLLFFAYTYLSYLFCTSTSFYFSVLVLSNVAILITIRKHYVNITRKNIAAIYWSSVGTTKGKGGPGPGIFNSLLLANMGPKT